MSEVPLYRGTSLTSKRLPLEDPTVGPCLGPCGDPGGVYRGWTFLMREVPLYRRTWYTPGVDANTLKTVGCAGTGRVEKRCSGLRVALGVYGGTSLIRKRPPLGPYSRPMPRALRWSEVGLARVSGDHKREGVLSQERERESSHKKTLSRARGRSHTPTLAHVSPGVRESRRGEFPARPHTRGHSQATPSRDDARARHSLTLGREHARTLSGDPLVGGARAHVRELPKGHA